MTQEQARQRIEEQLGMQDGPKQLNLSKRKVPVNKNSFNLIIGLGGTGCQAMIETKGLIELSCENPDTNVVYLPFDTAEDDLRNLVSSYRTGRATMKNGEAEQTLMKSDGLDRVFAPAFIDVSYSANPEIFEWIDQNQTPSGASIGASGIRQIGRLIFLKNNLQMVRDAVHAAVHRLAQSGENVKNPFLNVYILSGISGGTGSGTFIDMAHVVRDALAKEAGFVEAHHRIFGYLFMPDINEQKSGTDKNALNRNAYAAFQELDYNLNLQDLGEQYTMHMRASREGLLTITPGAGTGNIFDYIHLVSATRQDGTTVSNAYEYSMLAIAQNILSFVADEQAIGVSGTTTFAIDSHYSNINNQITMYRTGNKEHAHRYQGYLAIGSYSYDLPIDDMMMYIASKLFENMRQVYDQRPKTDNEYVSAAQLIGIQLEQIVEKFANAVPALRFVNSTNVKEPINYEERVRANYNNSESNKGPYQAAVLSISKAINDQFDKVMDSWFVDKTKGPVYANQIIVTNELGLLDKLDELRKKLMDIPDGAFVQWVGGHVSEVRATKENLGGLSANKKAETLAAYNSAGKRLYNRANLYILRSYIEEICEKVSAHIVKQNNQLYGIVTATVVNLCEIFKENAGILSRTTETMGARGDTFTWEPLSIPKLNAYLTAAFDAIFQRPDQDLIGDFLTKLWEAAKIWVKNTDLYDPKQLVSDYINEKFGALAQSNIENVVFSLLAPGQTPNQACDSLLKKLVSESAPLFYPKSGIQAGNQVMLISVPTTCQTIANYLQKNMPKNAQIQTTSVNTRIYAQTVQCGITLAHYQQIWNAEKTYAQYRGNVGLHLIDPANRSGVMYAPKDPVSWMTLPTLIPRELRPTLIDADIRPMLGEEEADKARIKTHIHPDQYGVYGDDSSDHPAIQLSTTAVDGEWVLTLILSNVQVETAGSVLTLKKSDRPFYVCDYRNPAENPRIVEQKLHQVLESGFNAEDPEAPGRKLFPDVEIVAKAYRTAVVRAGGIIQGERTLDNLTELYIQAIYAKHDFVRELEKYEKIRTYLQEKKAYEDTVVKKREDMYAYAVMLMLEQIQKQPVKSKIAGAIFVNNQWIPYAILPETYRTYEEAYEMHKAFVKRLNAEPINKEDNANEEARRNMQRAFSSAVEKQDRRIQEAVNLHDPLCQEWLERAEAMLREAKEINNSPEFANTRNGLQQSVHKDVLSFYELWQEALENLVKNLRFGANQTAAAFSASVSSTGGKDSDDLDFSAFSF